MLNAFVTLFATDFNAFATCATVPTDFFANGAVADLAVVEGFLAAADFWLVAFDSFAAALGGAFFAVFLVVFFVVFADFDLGFATVFAAELVFVFFFACVFAFAFVAFFAIVLTGLKFLESCVSKSALNACIRQFIQTEFVGAFDFQYC